MSDAAKDSFSDHVNNQSRELLEAFTEMDEERRAFFVRFAKDIAEKFPNESLMPTLHHSAPAHLQ